MIYQVHQQDAELRGEERGEERGIAIGKERGIAIGKERGIAIGVKQEKVNAAKGLLREGLGIDMIARVTGLPINEINKLKAAPSAN